jgi:hypothetical protein
MPNDVHLSKTLSWILRHGADRCGLSIDANGYVSIEALLQTEQLRKTKCTRIDIERIVSTNDKQRFAISSDGAMIRANQGHSMQCVKQCDLQLITDPVGAIIRQFADQFVIFSETIRCRRSWHKSRQLASNRNRRSESNDTQSYSFRIGTAR